MRVSKTKQGLACNLVVPCLTSLCLGVLAGHAPLTLPRRAAGKRDSCPVCEVRCRGLDRDNPTGVMLPTAAQMRKLRHCKVATSLSQGCANRACCCQSSSPGSRSDQRPGSLQGRASGRPGPWAPERHPRGLVSPLLPHSGPPLFPVLGPPVLSWLPEGPPTRFPLGLEAESCTPNRPV